MRASVKKKTHNLDSGMIKTVRRLFDAKTDTEAIQRALRKAIDDREVEDALDVVAYELRASAADGRTSALVREFTRPMERTGRVVRPTFDDWMMAAEVVAGIRQRDRGWRSKLPALLNDILIALCARRIRALVITRNGEDVRLIRRHVGFSLRVLEFVRGG